MKIKEGTWSGVSRRSNYRVIGLLAYDDYWSGQEYTMTRAYIMPVEANIILPAKNNNGLITKWHEINIDTLEEEEVQNGNSSNMG